jgi:hypothetical protein
VPKALGRLRRNTRTGPARRVPSACRGELIRVFRPDDGRVKAFCSVCGSSLFGAEWPEGDEVAIRLGSLDADPGIRPQFHTFVASRAPWDEIADDGLPRYDEGHS